MDQSFENLPAQANELKGICDGFATGNADSEQRKRALQIARSMVASLETPGEVIMRYTKSVLCERSALRMGVDLRIFHTLVDAGGPVSAHELSKPGNAEEMLVVRLMRMICAMGFARETDVQQYAPTRYTRAMTDPAMEGGVIVTHDFTATTELPAYFREKGYRAPTDNRDTPFAWVYETDEPYFARIHSSPRAVKAFNDFLTAVRSTRLFWADWCDTKSIIGNDFDPSQGRPLIVDIGGGKGHDLQKLVECYPQFKGSLVLQDLEKTITGIEPGSLNERIRPMAYDFFTPQPVKGAKLYFLHLIMHDWPDSDCQKILSQIKDAMLPGYSKILLNEIVVSSMNPSLWHACNDLQMMALFGGMERSKEQWHALLKPIGLRISKIWSPPPQDKDGESLIEVVLDNDPSA